MSRMARDHNTQREIGIFCVVRQHRTANSTAPVVVRVVVLFGLFGVTGTSTGTDSLPISTIRHGRSADERRGRAIHSSWINDNDDSRVVSPPAVDNKSPRDQPEPPRAGGRMDVVMIR
ncbi:hypothetical protein BGY98DRAFT_934362 [Russula aff. rugulosa BPL654]|nr:hypothetical protein BGY98DRAFT_934362 [Russula aff. rugulosa BPL654]